MKFPEMAGLKNTTTWQIIVEAVFNLLKSIFQVQSHSYIRRGNRRLSLTALPDLPAASRGVKLPLLADTRSVLQSL